MGLLKVTKKTSSEIKAYAEAKLNNSLGWLGGSLSKARINAVKYYRGDFFGNEQEGRSKVVSRDVAEAIDSAMPSLLKPFVESDQIVVFKPRRPEDEAAAAQATDYINWVFQNQPNFFELLQTWLKSGLMSQIGVVKSWWDDSVEVTIEDYEGLTRFQYLTLLSDDDVDLVKMTPQAPEKDDLDPYAAVTAGPAIPPAATAAPGGPAPPGAPAGLPNAPPLNPGAVPQNPANMPGRGPQLPGPMLPPQPSAAAAAPQSPLGSSITPPLGAGGTGELYDCRIKRTTKRGHICIEALPPEEFLTDRRAVSLGEVTFTAHRSRRTVTDLIEMGFPKKLVMTLPGSDDLDFNQEVINRFKPEDEEPRRDADSLDPAMRGVWLAECYMKMDIAGDDVAKWHKIFLAGGGGYELLEVDDADGHPFSAWTPYLQPHKLYGESMADKTMDIQLIKSTVWRQILDGMYFNNAPQLAVIEGQANMEDVLTRRPGGVIRMKSANAVIPIPTQDASASGFQMISMLDSIRETRTGIRRFSAGIDGDDLNPYASTATGANIVNDSSQDAILLIARNFAEMGLKPLFKRLLELTCKYSDKKQTVRLRGKWVDIDPSTWNTEMDMTVTVGLGTGDKTRQVQQLMTMLSQVDQPIVQLQQGLSGPLLTATNVYNKLKKLTESMGYKDADAFYTDPANAPPQQQKPQPPDPKLAIEQARGANQLKVVQAKAQADQATENARMHADLILETVKAHLKEQDDARNAQMKTMSDAAEHHRKTQEAGLKHVLDFVSKIHGANLQAATAAHAASLQPTNGSGNGAA